MDKYELVERYTLKAARWTMLDGGLWNGAKGSKGGVKIWMDGERPTEVSVLHVDTFARGRLECVRTGHSSLYARHHQRMIWKTVVLHREHILQRRCAYDCTFLHNEHHL